MLVPVVAGVLRDDQGRVLLSQRPAGKHLAGTWEFPGGKLEPGESPEVALARELAEELGIDVRRSDPLLTITHHYDDLSVRLLLRTVGSYRGRIVGREGQALDWVLPERARGLPMPAADRPLVKALSLDARYSIGPDPDEASDPGRVLQDWERRLRAGYRWLQLRAEQVSPRALPAVAEECGQRARAHRARWLLNGPPALAVEVGADGVHLSGRALQACRSRPLADEYLVCASCQTLADLEHAGRLGLDFVTLGPFESWRAFERLCVRSPLPVLAQGGIGPEDLARARACGAFGVAGVAGGCES